MNDTVDVSNCAVKLQIGLSDKLERAEAMPPELPTATQAELCVVVGDPGGEAFPCLNRFNSGMDGGKLEENRYKYCKKKGKKKKNNNKKNKGGERYILTPGEAKTAYALGLNVHSFCGKYGLEKCGFFTLTFKENLQDFKEAQRRFNNLAGDYIRVEYGPYICIMQLQKRGAVHYHLLVSCKNDIRTGFDFEAVDDDDYSSASRYLKRLWYLNGEASESHGFGRTELLPIKSTSKGVGKYLGRYLSKGERTQQIKGARTVRYSKGFRVANSQFAWVSTGAYKWRREVKKFAEYNNVTYEQMSKVYGSRWAYYLMKAFKEREIRTPEEISESVAYELNFEMSCRQLSKHN